MFSIKKKILILNTLILILYLSLPRLKKGCFKLQAEIIPNEPGTGNAV